MNEGQKVCATCGVPKDAIRDFHLHGSHRNPARRRPNCKECRRKEVLAYQAKPEFPEQRRWSRLKRLYGLTKEQYLELLAEQDGRCAICRTDDAGPWGFFLVDHDHRCCPGEKSCGSCVRGLLCIRCNGALGWLEEHLPAAWEYLHVPHTGWRSLRDVLTQAGGL